MLSAARNQIRSKFRENRNLAPDAAAPAISLAHDVARILRSNIVQGQRIDGDIYRMHDLISST